VDATLPATASGGVTMPLSQDHEGLRERLRRAGDLAEAGHLRQARTEFRAFQAVLERHVRAEEEVLFPLFEVRVGLVGGPTVLMRDEHRRMADHVRAMAQALDRDDRTAFTELRALFGELFLAHASKEERFLYMTLDRLLSSEQRAALAERLRQS
jgi:hemerythrin-like domain-containing protein